MSERYPRTVQDSNALAVQGVYTWGITDCSAIAIAEWVNGQWRRFYFEHVKGGHVLGETEHCAREAIGDRGQDCYAVVADCYGGVAVDSADGLFNMLRVPKSNRSYYVSKTDPFNFGVRFRFGEFGECEDKRSNMI